MSLNKLIIIFAVILVIFAGVVFFQFRTNPRTTASNSPTSTVKINNHTFKVELAMTPKEQQIGLSDHESLPQDQGMLFLFEEPGLYSFWMKNMKFPIDIIFIQEDTVVSVTKNAEPLEPEDTADPVIITPESEIDTVLEVNSGLSDKYNIKKGDKVEITIPE